jgi:tetratricopeptide (TPR) repeat protein
MKRSVVMTVIAALTTVIAFAQTPTEDGIRLFKEGKQAEAKPLLVKAVTDNPKDAAAHAYLALVLRNVDHDFDKAIEHAEQAVALADGNADYHFWLGSCYIAKAQGLGMFKVISLAKKTKACCERAVALNPKHVEARMFLFACYLNAPGILGGSISKAKEQAEAIEKLDPFLGNAAFASIHRHEKEWPEAERRYRQAIAIDPKKADIRNNFGYLLLGRNRVDEAIAEFKAAVELTPNDANAHDSLAEGYLTKGLVDEAIAEYQAALALNPAFPSSFIGLGRCYEKQSKWNEARTTYQQLIDALPKHRLAGEARSRLKELAKKG